MNAHHNHPNRTPSRSRCHRRNCRASGSRAWPTTTLADSTASGSTPPSEPAELTAAAERIVATSPEPGAEEWAIFDYDNFGPYRVGEYEDLEHVAVVARGIAEDGEAFAAYAKLSDKRGEDLEAGYIEAFVGYWHSLSAFVDDLLDDLGAREAIAELLPGWLAGHVSIDRDGVLRDLLVDLHYEDASDGGVYLFRL